MRHRRDRAACAVSPNPSPLRRPRRSRHRRAPRRHRLRIPSRSRSRPPSRIRRLRRRPGAAPSPRAFEGVLPERDPRARPSAPRRHGRAVGRPAVARAAPLDRARSGRGAGRAPDERGRDELRPARAPGTPGHDRGPRPRIAVADPGRRGRSRPGVRAPGSRAHLARRMGPVAARSPRHALGRRAGRGHARLVRAPSRRFRRPRAG